MPLLSGPVQPQDSSIRAPATRIRGAFDARAQDPGGHRLPARHRSLHLLLLLPIKARRSRRRDNDPTPWGEKGKKVGEKEKEGEDKAESGELPDAEESPMEQTQFFTEGKDGSAKKGGRPRKKDLDEKMDGVAKLRCTGPSGATNDSLINSDDDEETVKGKDSHKLSEEV